MTPDPDAAADSARLLRDTERSELAAADDGWTRRPIGYTGPVWAEFDIPSRAECDRDEVW
jgi:hypothetical protein